MEKATGVQGPLSRVGSVMHAFYKSFELELARSGNIYTMQFPPQASLSVGCPYPNCYFVFHELEPRPSFW